MRIHWASVRSVALVVILGLQSVGLTALAFSFLLIGVVAGRAMDDVFTPGQHVVTITMVTVGAVFVAGCVTAAMAAVAIGAELGYRGTPHAALWRTAVGLAVLLQAGWVLLAAGGTADGSAGDRIGATVALAAGLTSTVWCVMAWRDRSRPAPAAVPPPPVPVG
jgi:hypothetical protein